MGVPAFILTLQQCRDQRTGKSFALCVRTDSDAAQCIAGDTAGCRNAVIVIEYSVCFINGTIKAQILFIQKIHDLFHGS